MKDPGGSVERTQLGPRASSCRVGPQHQPPQGGDPDARVHGEDELAAGAANPKLVEAAGDPEARRGQSNSFPAF